MNAQLQPYFDFQREAGRDVLGDIAPLLERHYLEIAHYHDIALSVSYDTYLRLEAAGGLRIYTIRLDGGLVGYGIFLVSPSLHYSGSLQARQDVIYLDEAYRRGRLGLRFIKYCEDQLRLDDVQVLYHHEKIAHPALGRLLEHLGYEAVDRIWAKRLDKEETYGR